MSVYFGKRKLADVRNEVNTKRNIVGEQVAAARRLLKDDSKLSWLLQQGADRKQTIIKFERGGNVRPETVVEAISRSVASERWRLCSRLNTSPACSYESQSISLPLTIHGSRATPSAAGCATR